MQRPPEFSGRGAIAWMAKNSVAANLLMFVIIVGGIIGLLRTKQEVFPEFELDMITIAIPYPGASPLEVEQGVLLVIEEAVRGIDGVKRVTTAASESMGSVLIELLLDADPDKVLADVKSAVDRIQTFPVEAEEPRISILTPRLQVISLILAGDDDIRVLHDIAEKVREDLLASDDITQVEIEGVRPLEMSIEISRETLESYGLTLEEVALQVSAASVELPVGSIETRYGDLLIRVTDRRKTVEDYENIVLRGTATGLEVRLGEIARITDGYEEGDQEYYYNGQRAVRLTAYRVGDETPLQVATAVKNYAEKLKKELPPRFTVATWADTSEILEDRIDLLIRNAWTGFFLVFIVLALFLKLRLAIWVAMGIPTSFMSVFAVMPTFDISINMITLFAMIVTLGMVVDDAIVVGENVFSKMEAGKSRLQAAMIGAKEMAVPVTFSVLTTVAAFGALFFVPGVSGKFFRMIPAVVVAILMASLVESFFILPAHLGHGKERKRGILFWLFYPFDLVQRGVSQALEWFIRRIYKPVVGLAVTLRYLVIFLSLLMLVGSVALVATGFLPFRFFPALEGDQITASVKLPFGAPLEQTLEVRRQLEESARQVIAENGGDAILRGIFTRVGEAGGFNSPLETGSHVVSVEVNLVPIDERPITSTDFAAAWARYMPKNPNIKTLTFNYATGPAAGAPIDVQLTHPDNELLALASEEMTQLLKERPELVDVENAFSGGKPQYDFSLLPQARSLGLTSFELARQLRSAFFGAEALREQRGRNELKVVVRLPKEQRQSRGDLENLLIRTPTGGHVPLSYVATYTRNQSPTTINREDGKRKINVTANLAAGVPSPTETIAWLNKEALPELMQRYPGLGAELVGEQREQQEAFGNLGQNYIISLFVIFALLAIPFKSYTQPFIVMSAIPFGFVGAILGHILMGFELSMISLFGIVALSGVVVNDSLVLIDATNHARASGMTAREAIIYGGTRRLRPILLTSLTTFGGLMPMIFETSLQARFLIPMAISLGFGVMFATFVILLLVPALYIILDDFHRLFAWFGRLLGGGEDEESASPKNDIPDEERASFGG